MLTLSIAVLIISMLTLSSYSLSFMFGFCRVLFDLASLEHDWLHTYDTMEILLLLFFYFFDIFLLLLLIFIHSKCVFLFCYSTSLFVANGSDKKCACV